MRRGRGVLIAAVALLCMAIAASAAAAKTGLAPGQMLATASATNGWVVFGQATWSASDGNPAPGLVTTSQQDPLQPYGVASGGATLSGSALPTTNPKKITALSYDFRPAQLGPSGGSPRMVICFDDAANCSSNADLGPNNWTTTAIWTTVDGFQPSGGLTNVWVNNGGTCGYLYNTTWSNIVACHPPPTKITEVLVVNDSGWEYPMGSLEQVTLDNLDVNGVVATGP
jgi:hypothetical protein